MEKTNTITRSQLHELAQLNELMLSSKAVALAMSTDVKARNLYNINYCRNAMSLYNYLYQHYNELHKIFRTDNYGNMDMILANRIRHELLNYMRTGKISARQAIDKLYLLRESSEYKGNLG